MELIINKEEHMPGGLLLSDSTWARVLTRPGPALPAPWPPKNLWESFLKMHL